MKISILEKTSDYRGDHSADITRAHRYYPQEHIEELIKRCLRGNLDTDWLELRIEKEGDKL